MHPMIQLSRSLIHALTFFSLSVTFFQQVHAANDVPSGNVYKLSDNIQGPAFFNAFEWENIPDPTHGRVTYVDRATAQRSNLSFATPDTFIVRTDSTTVLNPAGPGRNSVRIRSKKTYTTHVAVFDIRHMPQGCGTWPAVWEVGPQWPFGGEVDILEGVNDESPNAATLHTGPDCTMSGLRRSQLGIQVENNCDATVNSNIGCPVKFPTIESYGPAFNKVGGGWYAIERSPTYIKVWFWGRNDPNVPAEVKGGSAATNPDSWGTPTAFFPNDSCNMNQHFSEHSIIINLTLCGDWAGSVYPQSGCPSTCVDLVNNNPAAFSDAYFDFSAIRVYLK